MADASRNSEHVDAAVKRAKQDAARTRERVRREPPHPARNTSPRANPDRDDGAVWFGAEKLDSVIPK